MVYGKDSLNKAILLGMVRNLRLCSVLQGRLIIELREFDKFTNK